MIFWNAIISGNAQNERFDKALDHFNQMRFCGVKTHLDMFSNVLPTCANLAALEHGRVIHAYVIKNGFHPNTFMGNALIDLYAKCGTIEDTYKVFDKIPRWDVVSCSAMIMGHSIHGHGKEALNFFEQMWLS